MPKVIRVNLVTCKNPCHKPHGKPPIFTTSMHQNMKGEIIAIKDQLVLLSLDQFFTPGDIVDVITDSDERYVQIRRPEQPTRYSIYKELIRIL